MGNKKNDKDQAIVNRAGHAQSPEGGESEQNQKQKTEQSSGRNGNVVLLQSSGSQQKSEEHKAAASDAGEKLASGTKQAAVPKQGSSQSAAAQWAAAKAEYDEKRNARRSKGSGAHTKGAHSAPKQGATKKPQEAKPSQAQKPQQAQGAQAKKDQAQPAQAQKPQAQEAKVQQDQTKKPQDREAKTQEIKTEPIPVQDTETSDAKPWDLKSQAAKSSQVHGAVVQPTQTAQMPQANQVPQQAAGYGAVVAASSGLYSNNGANASNAYPQQGYVNYANAQQNFQNPNGGGDSRTPEEKAQRRKKLIIGISAVVAALACIYIGVAIYFGSHFMPNSTIGAIDISRMSDEEAAKAIDNELKDYSLTVQGYGFKLNLSSSDIGVNASGKEVVKTAHTLVNEWLWPIEIFRSHDYSTAFDATFNTSVVHNKVNEAVTQYNATAIPTQSAGIAYSETKAAFEITPEVYGTTLVADEVMKSVSNAIASLKPELTLTKNELEQPKVVSSDARLVTACESANKMLKTNMPIMLADVEAVVIDASYVSKWVTIDESVNATVDDQLLGEWVDTFVSEANTVGSTRSYVRADGKEVTVSGGTYGWEFDGEDLAQSIKEGILACSTQPIQVACTSEGSAYNGAGQRDWGTRYIDVDLSEQHVYMYDADGTLIWESDCVSGSPSNNHATPEGVYCINYKESPSKLIGYTSTGEKEYETTVQYWMPFVGNGIGLHDASWQPGFGGTLYTQGYGSHGCINLPMDAAASIYDLCVVGDPVVVHS